AVCRRHRLPPSFPTRRSSDLTLQVRARRIECAGARKPRGDATRAVAALPRSAGVGIPDAVRVRAARITRLLDHQQLIETDAGMAVGHRSEERRVGKECRSRWEL